MFASPPSPSLPALLAIVLAIGCGDNSSPVCKVLFGAPTANTGLSADDCQPSCGCNDGFEPAVFSEATLVALESAELESPPPLSDESPYVSPEDHPQRPEVFCAVIPLDGGTYRLETMPTLEAVAAAGGTVTHHGACGQCSSLRDLAVYVRNRDLAGPVRQCGIDTLGGGEPENTACLMEIGFTHACAQIWAYNTINTREKCLSLCFAALDAPYHTADGALNPCIQCDEDESGLVFKAVAGRTRRNSGLASALCRPCESVAPVTHQYDL